METTEVDGNNSKFRSKLALALTFTVKTKTKH